MPLYYGSVGFEKKSKMILSLPLPFTDHCCCLSNIDLESVRICPPNQFLIVYPDDRSFLNRNFCATAHCICTLELHQIYLFHPRFK